MRTIIGADRKIGGKIFLKGKEVTGNWNTTKALKAGIGLLPEDRKTQGFMKQFTNYDNIAISSLEKNLTAGFLDQGKKLKNAEYFFEELDVHPRKPDYLTVNMSGGNQQKVILARWMSTDVDVIIFDEPTKGVDVAAKAEIYRLMEELVEEATPAPKQALIGRALDVIVYITKSPEGRRVTDILGVKGWDAKNGEYNIFNLL